MSEERFDYIVVGGGSSGSVVAGELARDPRLSIALIELGDRADDHPETLAADGYKDAFANDALVLERFSQPQPECGNQRLFLASGKGLGGSGAINGMVYTRGSREDYATWGRGWSYDELLPSFEAVERQLRIRPRAPTEFTEAFVHAAEQAGFRRSSLHDGDLSGVIGYQPMNYEGDRRRSSYVAFVRDPARPNLQIFTRSVTRRVVFEGTRAVGVEIQQGDSRRVLRAEREVVLCAGALETPKLLMLSGVGPAGVSKAFGASIVRDIPAVGQNLHDHPNVTFFFVGRQAVDAYYPQLYAFHRANPASDLPAGQSDTCYVMYPARSSLREAAMRMVPPKLPGFLYGDQAKSIIRGGIALATGLSPVQRLIERTWGCVTILGKPKSRGSLTLGSHDPTQQAILDPAYFRHPEDMETMVKGVRLARKIAGGNALKVFGNLAVLPPAMVDSDSALATFIEYNAMTTFHYAGTCRMGADADAVVDLELRVRGLQGLRVADASIAPFTPVSAMNAPSMMIGMRAARFIQRGIADAPSAHEARESV